MESTMKILKELIIERSFKKTDTPSILLSSGKMSCFYFNMKKVTYYPAGQVLIGERFTIKLLNLVCPLMP
jgi:orotate phosphoribosyltransferase